MSIRHAILGVLTDATMHGYQIARELERLIPGGHYNSGQIYQGIRWLEEHGQVVAQPTVPGALRERRPCSATALGRQEFQRWLREPLVPARPLRDDAVIKLVFLGRDDPGLLIGTLERLRRQHLHRLTGTELKAAVQNVDDTNLAGDTLLAELSGAALRFREQAELRWIDYCLLRLRALDSSEEERSRQDGSPAEGRGEPQGIESAERAVSSGREQLSGSARKGH